MNNEEKIIQLLENLTVKVEKLDNSHQHMQEDIQHVKENQKHMQAQIKENTDIIKALVHSNEFIKAKIDSMETNIAHIEGDTRDIRETINAVESITVRNWSDIINLKKAK